MKTKIIDKLKTLEKEKNIEILFAIESGSRSWGFASPDSDYDIRFIYKHPIDWYLSPWEKRDTIEFMTEDDLDGSGWDLKKTFHLLNKSNVPLLEHLFSHIFYIKNDTFLEKMTPLTKEAFSPVAVVFHYLSISKKYLESCNKDEVKLKDYFYCLRTTLASKWVVEIGTFPPVIFHEMLDLLPENMFYKVQFLLNVKSENGEKYFHTQDWELFEYLKSEIENLSEKAKTLTAGNLDKSEAEKVFVELLKS
ncbi:MAG: nucleotidyltransferase domain-containing protein [Chryseobacterium sp.]|nr:MAG: nucleotidyltransferase domain-containing protein [Chryseobacterium sp.]